MRFAFIQVEKAEYPVEILCRTMEVSRSGFYAWQKRKESSRARSNRDLSTKIREVYQQSRGRYGSPRVQEELKAQGIACSKKRVARLMKAEGLHARRRRSYKKTTDSKHDHPVAPNLLERDFHMEKADQAWVADITYIPTGEGWLYLAVVLDLFSRMVVGWAMSSRIDTRLTLDALEMALRKRCPEAGLIHHSDRGSQYASDDYQKVLEQHGVVPSMSRVGDCWDNAVVESFFGSLKVECVYQQSYPTRAAARVDVFAYIEVFYNRTRRHSYLGYQNPVDFEKMSMLGVA